MGLVSYLASVTVLLLAIAFELHQLQIYKSKLISAEVKAYQRIEHQVPRKMRVQNHILDEHGNYQDEPCEEHVYGPPRIEYEWKEINSFQLEDYTVFIQDKTIYEERFASLYVHKDGITFYLQLNVDYRNAYRYRNNSINFYVTVFKNIVANAISICLMPLVVLSPTTISVIVQMSDGMIITSFMMFRGTLAFILECFGINSSFLFYLL